MNIIEIPIEVKSTTIQINSIMKGIEEREHFIEHLKEKNKVHQESFHMYQAALQNIDEMKKLNKDDRKLIEMLVEYVKKNYNVDFDPGDLFNQDNGKDQINNKTKETQT